MENGEPYLYPKCDGKMTLGFMLDGVHGGWQAGRWIEGTPEKSFWVGLKIGDRPQFQLSTYRCDACGFLESYADQPLP